jgi:sensor histidine kinase YesM
MTKRQKIIFWTVLTSLLFLFFRWLSGIALPEMAFQFSLVATTILISGLMAGHLLMLLAIRSNALTNARTTVFLLSAFVLAGFLIIAYLLNAMIEKTTLFPFAITLLILWLVTAAVGSLITIFRHQYKTRIQLAQVDLAQSKSELQLLQARLSPHFLFNTLNNIYGLSITDSQRVPALLLKLSDLLRYSVYDVRENFVPLQQEVDYIRNYVEFERLRLDERLILNMEMDAAVVSDCSIPPLMLIVFVENAFKHSRTTGNEPVRIDIVLRTHDKRIYFSVSNSYALEQFGDSRTETHSGFGTESVRKRLDLLYAGKHQLEIERKENLYTVILQLECK